MNAFRVHISVFLYKNTHSPLQRKYISSSKTVTHFSFKMAQDFLSCDRLFSISDWSCYWLNPPFYLIHFKGVCLRVRWAFFETAKFLPNQKLFIITSPPHPPIHSRFFKVALWSSAIEGLSSHTVFDGGFLDLIFYNQLEFVNPSPFPFLYGSDLRLLHGSSCCTHHLWAEPLWKQCLKSKGKSKALTAKVKRLVRCRGVYEL